MTSRPCRSSFSPRPVNNRCARFRPLLSGFPMNPDMIIGEVISSALGVRHGRRHRHHPFDLIVGGHPWWLNGGTLMTALGIAWGMLDTANAAPCSITTLRRSRRPRHSRCSHDSRRRTAAATVPAVPTVPIEVARVVRLTVSAARADGALTDVEQDAIRTRARAVGAEAARRRGAEDTDPAFAVGRGRTRDLAQRALHAGVCDRARRRRHRRRGTHLPGAARACARAVGWRNPPRSSRRRPNGCSSRTGGRGTRARSVPASDLSRRTDG